MHVRVWYFMDSFHVRECVCACVCVRKRESRRRKGERGSKCMCANVCVYGLCVSMTVFADSV